MRFPLQRTTAVRDRSAALLPVEERVRGPEHPNTLITRHQLAYWTGRPQMRPPHATFSPMQEVHAYLERIQGCSVGASTRTMPVPPVPPRPKAS